MKRRLLIAAVFLLAGAVVNVAVAWVVALAIKPKRPARSHGYKLAVDFTTRVRRQCHRGGAG